MKNTLFLFICTTIAQITVAQNVKLQIHNNETKHPIEFATVLLTDYKKSFVTNEKGLFVINASKYKFPLKVLIETFGFEKKEITLQNTTILNVFLEPSSELLQEIIIPPANAKIKERTFGRTNESSGRINGEDTTIGKKGNSKETDYEFGMIIPTKEKLIKVKKIHWHINGFTYKRAFFSVYFYEVQNGKPSKRIAHQNITFILSPKNIGWNSIDIEDLNIFLNKPKKIAVVLKQQKVDFEKEKNEGSFFLNIGLTTGNTFFTRSSSHEEWLTLPASFPFYITVDSYE